MTDQKNLPLKINCFHCQKLITVKYVRTSGDYSSKNNWGYWTEQAKNKNLSICDDCLVKLYRQHKWEFRRLIANPKKRVLFRQYLANDTITGKVEMSFITNRENGCCSHCSKKKKKNSSVEFEGRVS